MFMMRPLKIYFLSNFQVQKNSNSTYKVNYIIFIFVPVMLHLTQCPPDSFTNNSIFLCSKIMYTFLIPFTLFSY